MVSILKEYLNEDSHTVFIKLIIKIKVLETFISLAELLCLFQTSLAKFLPIRNSS